MLLSKDTLPDDRAEEGHNLLDMEKLEDDTYYDQNVNSTLASSSSPRSRVSFSTLLQTGGAHLRLSSMHRSWKQFLFFLLPTFIQSRFYASRTTTTPKRALHPTAWLDGMRGIAAFCVFIDHLSYSNHDTYTAYGYQSSNYEFFKLPFVRFLYTGASQVAIFFVVSGYALSYKPVKQMRNGEREGLLTTLSSSVFRRAIRLYLPCVASTLWIIFLVRAGAYEPTRSIAFDEKLLTGRREHHPFRYETTWKQLTVWVAKLWDFFNPFAFEIRGGDSALDIDGHLWTIPVEFRASLILYLTQLGLSRLKPHLRTLTLILLLLYVHQTNRWELLLFFSGFLLCELDIRRRLLHSPLPSSSPTSSPPTSNLWSFLYTSTFLLGLYLGSQPARDLEHAPGWTHLNALIPSHINPRDRYYPNFGAMLMVYATSNHVPLQRVFTNDLVQYLGKISYPLYLMHGAVIHTIGYGIMDFMWGAFGRETVFRKETGFVVAGFWVVVVTVWAADIFMRLVDTPTVKFAKWLEEKCVMKG